MQKFDETEAATRSFRRGLDVLGHFQVQVNMLGDNSMLELLGSVGSEPFTNGDARECLRVKRQASWKRLAQMCDAGLIQKRGHSYRVAPFTMEFVAALSSVLGALVTGRPVVESTPESRKALESAVEGLEALYSKGKLSQEEYVRHRATLEEMIGNVPS